MSDNTQSKLRLFLSVDVVGSTQLKDRQNYQISNNLYKTNQITLLKFIAQILDNDDLFPNKTGEEKEILEKISNQGNFLEQGFSEDWAKVLGDTFREFHAYFKDSNISCKPWKGLGDELIYSIEIHKKSDLHNLVVHFLQTINFINNRYIEKKQNFIRLKGSAWTAGFPIRNRVIKLPEPLLEDYLGPDMDIGFRLGKCTWPGFLAISMDLAELLAKCSIHQQVRLKLVKWEKLKGVWKEKPYPIFWAVLPDKTPDKDGKSPIPGDYFINYYNDGDEVESAYLYGWIHNEDKEPKEAKHFKDLIIRVRNAIPKEIGVVEPYIIDDDDAPDQMPPEHEEILRLLRNFNPDKQEDYEQQGTLPLTNGNEDYKSSIEEDIRKRVGEIKENKVTD